MKNSKIYPWVVVGLLGGVALLNYMDRQMLSTMKDAMQMDITKLPHPDELYDIYEQDPLIPFLDSIIMGYRRKIDLLNHFQESVIEK